MFNIYLIIICVIQIQMNNSQFLPILDPIQQIKQLQQQISTNIFSISNHYSELTRNLQDSIQNIVNQSPITASIEKLHSNINSFGRMSSPCSRVSESAISSLSESSKEDVSTCAGTALSVLSNNITLEAERLITKFVSLQGTITSRIAGCFKSNLANQVGLALCLLAQINPVQADLASAMQEIENTFALSEAVAQEIIFNLGNCILNVQNVVDNTASDIVNDFRSCDVI